MLALSLVVVLSTVIVFVVVALWQFFRTPFVEASGSSNHHPTFENQKRYNVCLILIEDLKNPVSHIKALTVLSFDPIENSLSVISVPVEASVEAAAGYGRNKISSLYALGEITEPKMNVDMVVRSLSSSLAIPIDAYVLTDVSGFEELSSEMGQSFTLDEVDSVFTVRFLPKTLALLRLSRKNLRTNLDLYEVTRMVRFMLKVRSDKIITLKLDRSDLEDYEVLDGKLADFVLDNQIAGERLKVQVLNGTLIDGLAGRAARQIENLGAEVLSVGNAEPQNQKLSVLISNDLNSSTFRRLKEIFKITQVRGSVEGIEERADITLILGLDISDRL